MFVFIGEWAWRTKAEVERSESSRVASLLSAFLLSLADSMVVLKGIPAVLSPELLYALAKMGHGDELGTIRSYMQIRGLSPLLAALAVVDLKCGETQLVWSLTCSYMLHLCACDFYLSLQFLLMQTFPHLPFVLVAQKRYELMVCKHTYCWVGGCVKSGWCLTLCRFGNPTAPGGYLEVVAPGHLCFLSGTCL